MNGSRWPGRRHVRVAHGDLSFLLYVLRSAGTSPRADISCFSSVFVEIKIGWSPRLCIQRGPPGSVSSIICAVPAFSCGQNGQSPGCLSCPHASQILGVIPRLTLPPVDRRYPPLTSVGVPCPLLALV